MIDSAPPLVEYALAVSCSCATSPLASTPTKTPMLLFVSASRERRHSPREDATSTPPCSAAYPTWSTRRCCGSKDRASIIEIPKAARSTHSWSPHAKDPYVDAGPASGVGVAHRAAGTRVFTSKACVDSSRSAASEPTRPASWKRQAAMTTVLRPPFATLETSRDAGRTSSGRLARPTVALPEDNVDR